MRSYRIGKTLKIRWTILSGGAPEPLAGRDLTLEISSGTRVRTTLPFVADGNVAVFYYQGRDQRFTGTYTVTMWENYAKEGQTVVDRCDAFALVGRSCEEVRTTDSDLGEGELEIEPTDLEIGVPGMSAYELYIRHNPDSQLTEEEYAESPVQAAGAALSAMEQLEETEASVKQSEQIREQSEQGREASEQARATAEQTRVTAEQQRALAEQTRVTNESARQKAEAGRQAAETKREDNTAEAIRNSEEATRKAEDEAARVRTLADNPPKIVEVEGAKYWAFWDEETEQYVVSENRADVGDAVLFSPQTLAPQQRKQVQKNITPGGYMRPLFEAAGAVYNEATGFYELNGLTDITEDEIADIYSYYTNVGTSYVRRYSEGNQRTYFPIKTFWGPTDWTQAYSFNDRLKRIKIQIFGRYVFANNIYAMFGNDSELEVIDDIININSDLDSSTNKVFQGCRKLQSFEIWNLNSNISTSDSPLVNYNSILATVNRAIGSRTITFTVHPTTYSYLMGTVEPTEQVGGTTEEWQALVTAAQEKQISFVSA